MIERDLAPVLVQNASWYPIVTVTGPRQSGKTTLVRSTFPDLPYISLEPLDVRARVREDPRGFLAEHRDGAIVDEVQQVPELLSYLQIEVDERPWPGRFVLTGSQHLGLSQAVAQSLAGRTAILHLHPPSYPELLRFPSPPTDLWETIWAGSYPRIWDTGVPPSRWLADYTTTYVERDVRRILDVGDLVRFRSFVELCAGRTAQEQNLDRLGGDAGIARATARSWLSVLEATFLLLRLPAWSPNVQRRAVKAPKLHLADTGLACHLLGIGSAEQLRRHPLRGALFESWVATEIRKAGTNRGVDLALRHYRETRGTEAGLVVAGADGAVLIEAKSGATIAGDWFAPLRELLSRSQDLATTAVIVYGGDARQRRHGVSVQPWMELHDLPWVVGR